MITASASPAELAAHGSSELDPHLGRPRPPETCIEWLGIAVARQPELAQRARTSDEINRRQARWAHLHAPLLSALTDAIAGADENGAIRVTLLTGTADSFTSGNDLNNFLAGNSSNDNPVERGSCTARVCRHRLDIATMAPARPALWLDHAAVQTSTVQRDDAPSHVGVAVGPFQGGENVRANRTIGILDRDRTLQDGLKGLPDIKPLGLAAN